MIDINALHAERGLVKTTAGHIHYRAAGRGETILLFHNNQQSSALPPGSLAEGGVKWEATPRQHDTTTPRHLG